MRQNHLVTIHEAPPVPSDSNPQPSQGGGVVVLAWVAIGFGVLSLPGALIFVPGIRDTPLFDYVLVASNTAPLTAIISWVVAIIATAISGARLRSRSRNARRAFALAAPGALLGTAAIVFVVITIGNMLGLFQGNAAEEQGSRSVDHYLDQGASLICLDENNGYGINNTPWFQAFIDAPAELGTEAQAREALDLAGYSNSRVNELSDYYDLPENTEAFELRSIAAYTADYQDAPTSPFGTITVLPDGPVSISCTRPDGSYGDDLTPEDGRVIIMVQIILEPTR